MRRKDKEIRDPGRIEEILSSSLFCHLSMSDGDTPYCVPICYAYSNGRIILHSADEGRKIDILSKNPKVCILFEQGCEMVRGPSACEYGMRYETVMIEGTARFLTGTEKTSALADLGAKYTKEVVEPYSEDQIRNLAVIEVTITSCSGKRSGFPS